MRKHFKSVRNEKRQLHIEPWALKKHRYRTHSGTAAYGTIRNLHSETYGPDASESSENSRPLVSLLSGVSLGSPRNRSKSLEWTTSETELFAAHFPPNIRSLEEFDSEEPESEILGRSSLCWKNYPGWITMVIMSLRDLRILVRPNGLWSCQQRVYHMFRKDTNLIRTLDTSKSEHATEFHLKNIRKIHLVIIDEISYTLISRNRQTAFLLLALIPMKLVPSFLPPPKGSLTR